MKRFCKAITLFSLTSVVAVGLSGCSVLLASMNGDNGGSGSGGSGDGVVGTYTFDLTKYDPTWYQPDENGEAKIVDQATWSVTAGIDAYARSTLVLGEDGSYALTKEMGAGPIAEERWGKHENDKNFLKYTYYGTYTEGSDGLINLSECTSMDVETSVFEMSLEYGLGNFIIPLKTGVTDFGELAGTTGGQLVIDFLYGPYIVVSGRGNCEQTVQLGTYDYGTFTFVETEEEPAPGDDPIEKPVEVFEGYVAEGVSNAGIVLKLGLDGTYSFEWSAYNVTESGTYTWDRVEQKLTLSVDGAEPQVFTAENGKLSFNYKYTQEASLNQDYEIEVEELEEVICENIYSFIPTVNGKASLDIYADGTYTYVNGDVRESGTYAWDAVSSVLTLTQPDGATVVSTYQNNILTVNYVAVANEETFFGSVYGMTEAIPEGVSLVYAFTPAANAEILFNLYSDGTFEFAWAKNGVSEIGTWTYTGEGITISKDGVETEVSIIGDNISFTYYYSLMSQLNQSYTGKLSEIKANYDKVNGVEKIYTFTSAANASIVFDLYSDNTFVFAWAANNVTEIGTWKYTGEGIAISKNGVETPVTVAGDNISFTYYYSLMSQLNQSYTGKLSEIRAAYDKFNTAEKIYSFTPGANAEILFDLYSDGTFEFAWAKNGVSEIGTWKYTGEGITISKNGVETEVSIIGDNISFTYYYSLMSQLNQAYTGKLSEIKAAYDKVNGVEKLYTFTSATNAAIVFDLYSDGTFVFEWAANGVTEIGTWKYTGEGIAISKNGVATEVSIVGDNISFTYAYSLQSQLNQAYTGKLSEIKAAYDKVNGVEKLYTFTSATNAEIVFDLYSDGTFVFEWAKNGVCEIGTWTYTGEGIAISKNGVETEVSIIGDNISFTYAYSLQSQLNQAYTGKLSEIKAAYDKANGVKKVYTFTSATNAEIVFDLYSDNTFVFEWAKNGVTEIGTWSYANGALSISKGGAATSVSVEGDVISFTYAYSLQSQLNQGYTGSVAALESALAKLN